MKKLWIIWVACLTVVASASADIPWYLLENEERVADQNATLAEFDRIALEEIRFSDASILEALALINENLKSVESKRFVFIEHGLTNEFSKDPQMIRERTQLRKLNFKGERGNLLSVIEDISNESETVYVIVKEGIAIYPRELHGAYRLASQRIPPSLFAGLPNRNMTLQELVEVINAIKSSSIPEVVLDHRADFQNQLERQIEFSQEYLKSVTFLTLVREISRRTNSHYYLNNTANTLVFYTKADSEASRDSVKPCCER